LQTRSQKWTSWSLEAFKNIVLAATFGTTIWLGVSQRRANNASVAAETTSENSLEIANESLQLANTSLEVANKSLQAQLSSNNISANSNYEQALANLYQIYQLCEAYPSVLAPLLFSSSLLLSFLTFIPDNIYRQSNLR
jgi:hypothetical protein